MLGGSFLVIYRPLVHTLYFNKRVFFLLLCSLLQDLNDWTTLYAAGRLMKPVRSIINGSKEIKNALLLNRLHAVRTSLLLMPVEFNETELYHGRAARVAPSGFARPSCVD